MPAAEPHHLLMIDQEPRAERGSGFPRALALLEELAAHPSIAVTLLAIPDTNDRVTRPDLRVSGVRVVQASDPRAWLRDERGGYAVVVVSRPDVALALIPTIREAYPDATLVYDCEALSHRRMERAHDLGLPGMWSLTMTEERELLAAADLVLCVTPEELAVVEALVPDRPARLLAYGVDPDVAGEDRGWKERAGLLYYGGFAAGAGGPNEDALSWTVDAVMPELWRTHPDLVLTVVGAEPTPAVHALASPRIHVVGGVDDPRVALRAARVLVAPVRFGAGLKLRFVDAMACGLPFVTTTVGAEGFDLGDERALLVAESASGLADAIRRLYDDEDVWTRARARVAALFRRDFTRERFGASVTAIFTEIGLLPQSTTGP